MTNEMWIDQYFTEEEMKHHFWLVPNKGKLNPMRVINHKQYNDCCLRLKLIAESIDKLKQKVRDEINNPYTSEPKVHLGNVLKWIDESFGGLE